MRRLSNKFKLSVSSGAKCKCSQPNNRQCGIRNNSNRSDRRRPRNSESEGSRNIGLRKTSRE
jgi:hypothetical protein